MTREQMIDAAVRQMTSRELRPFYVDNEFVVWSRRQKIVRAFTRIASREGNK